MVPEGVLAWRDEFDSLIDWLGPLFVRPEPRRQAGRYLEGLLSGAARKNGWQLAEQIGDARPWRTQRVLSHVQWDQDAARDLCRAYVIEHIGRPDGVLVVDETGFLKKGTHSAGVAAQYSGTGGELSGGRFPCLCQPPWARADRPRALPATGLVCGCHTTGAGGHPADGGVCHQACPGQRDDRPCARCGGSLRLGARG